MSGDDIKLATAVMAWSLTVRGEDLGIRFLAQVKSLRISHSSGKSTRLIPIRSTKTKATKTKNCFLFFTYSIYFLNKNSKERKNTRKSQQETQ